MSPQNELPEGTDHIINGAMETGTGTGSGGSSGVGGGATSGGVSDGSALVATASGDDTGGNAGGGVTGQLRNQAYQLRDQGVDRVREFATGGKTRAGDALEELSRVFADTADTIDERMGREYGEYARKAADAVSNFAETLRNKEVEDIYDDVTKAVRKSPGIALGVAAVVGFAAARIVKAGLSEGGTGKGTRPAGGTDSTGSTKSGPASGGTGTGTTGA